MKELCRKPHVDIYRHLAFAVVGGFFASYAILCRMGVMANAQTMNLVELILNALSGDGHTVLLHLGSLAVYVLGTMLTVLLPHLFHWDPRHVCPVISALSAIILALIPQNAPTIPALYPIFFAMSFQWSSFTGADGYYSSTIFSTNNTKQTSLALAEYFCHRDQTQLRKARLFGLTLLCFHVGVAYAFLTVKLFNTIASLAILPVIIWCYLLVRCEDASVETHV
jgi:uncharacterized membrane protein YoaK (UPF0700 family)